MKNTRILAWRVALPPRKKADLAMDVMNLKISTPGLGISLKMDALGEPAAIVEQ